MCYEASSWEHETPQVWADSLWGKQLRVIPSEWEEAVAFREEKLEMAREGTCWESRFQRKKRKDESCVRGRRERQGGRRRRGSREQAESLIRKRAGETQRECSTDGRAEEQGGTSRITTIRVATTVYGALTAHQTGVFTCTLAHLSPISTLWGTSYYAHFTYETVRVRS